MTEKNFLKEFQELEKNQDEIAQRILVKYLTENNKTANIIKSMESTLRYQQR